MKPFQVPSREIPVRVRLTDGREHEGTFYAPVSGPQGGPGLLSDRLNEPDERFIPLTGEAGLLVLQKAWIVAVRLVGGEEERIAGDSPGATHADVEVRMADGATVRGMLAYEMPPGRQRLVDYLNNGAPQFLTVTGGASVMLVNRDRVVSLRTLAADRETR